MSETRTQATTGFLPASLSPREGILLLSLFLSAQITRLEHLLRLLEGQRRESLEPLLGDKQELQWRFRTLLASLDSRGWGDDGQQKALVEATGLTEMLQVEKEVPGRLFRERQAAKALKELIETEGGFEHFAARCRERFEQSLYKDEFRICAQLAADHSQRFRQETV